MIRLCDARKGLAQIKTASIDLIVCDPHYKNINGGNKNPKAPKGILINIPERRLPNTKRRFTPLLKIVFPKFSQDSKKNRKLMMNSMPS